MLSKEIKQFLSINGKKGIKALTKKYDKETRREWARKGGTQKGVNSKKAKEDESQ